VSSAFAIYMCHKLSGSSKCHELNESCHKLDESSVLARAYRVVPVYMCHELHGSTTYHELNESCDVTHSMSHLSLRVRVDYLRYINVSQT